MEKGKIFIERTLMVVIAFMVSCAFAMAQQRGGHYRTGSGG